MEETAPTIQASTPSSAADPHVQQVVKTDATQQLFAHPVRYSVHDFAAVPGGIHVYAQWALSMG